jgi:hypothetical protein
MKKIHNLIAVAGAILLLPIIISVPLYVSFIGDMFALLSLSQGDPRNIAGAVSAQIVTQIQVLIVSIPGLIAVSFAVIGLKLNSAWFSSILKVYGVLSICMLPVLIFAGIYVYFLSRKNRNFEKS